MTFKRILILLSLLSPPTLADNLPNDDLPTVKLMSCEGQCANFVPAKPISIEPPQFPHDQVGWTRIYSEANLNVLYTIGPDGKVRDDILVLSLIGPREFADATIEKIKKWTFEPATSDGKPVAQSRTFRMNYIRDPRQDGLIPRGRVLEVTQGWNGYTKAMEQGKTDEARASLENVLKNVGLQFADRTGVTAALADLAYKRGDYLEARRLAWDATTTAVKTNSIKEQVVVARKAPTDVLKNAWQNRFKADLALHDISDALNSLEQLQQILGASDSSLQGIVEKLRAGADAEPVLSTQAQIPQVEDGDVYVFLPYRRSFTFQKVQGALQKFVLACKQATMESDISPTAQWRIPNKWDGCSVYVRGTPGTKFVVMQPKE